MDTIKDFELKDRKYIPVFPKASGKPTIYIQGYPCEDDKPMPGTDFHTIQINTFYEQQKQNVGGKKPDGGGRQKPS